MEHYKVKINCVSGKVIESIIKALTPQSARFKALDIYKYQIYKNQGLNTVEVKLA